MIHKRMSRERESKRRDRETLDNSARKHIIALRVACVASHSYYNNQIKRFPLKNQIVLKKKIPLLKKLAHQPLQRLS